jgi:hypothetical protein
MRAGWRVCKRAPVCPQRQVGVWLGCPATSPLRHTGAFFLRRFQTGLNLSPMVASDNLHSGSETNCVEALEGTMKRARNFSLLIIAFAVWCGCCGCTGLRKAGHPPQIRLSGTAGAPITGYYLVNGKRVALAGVLPMTFTNLVISQIAVRKVNKTDNLEVAARTEQGSTSTSVPPGQDGGVRLELGESDMRYSMIPPEESLDAPGNALMSISPYWHAGTWVFDDAKAGLVREPFVAGVPEMINILVKEIPGAREGFRLTFSARPFPGFQRKLSWVRSESGGNYYRLSDPPMEGWLCPAMFRYFARTPKELYVKAEPISK